MRRWLLILLVLTVPFAAGAPPWSGLKVGADTFGLPLAQSETAHAYVGASVLLEPGDAARVTVVVPTAGDYTIHFDFAVPTAVLNAPEGQLSLNGATLSGNTGRVRFPVYYRNAADAFPQDRYGNDALIRQERDPRWTRVSTSLHLEAGEQQLKLTLISGAVYLGSLVLEPFAPPPDYAEYLEAHAALHNAAPSDFMLTLEAEFPTYKNDTAVRPANHRDLTVTPYHTSRLLLNTLGGESWSESGSAVFYEIVVPADGFYAITLRALQNTRRNFTVFRRVTINGEVPFAELAAVPFPYTPGWTNVTLGASDCLHGVSEATCDGTPYRIFLKAGRHVLGLEATNEPYAPAIATLQDALLDINALALEIRKLTGNQRDPFRDWVISDYLPDVGERLNTLIARLRNDQEMIRALNHGRNSPEAQSYQLAIDNLSFFASDPNTLPAFPRRFSEGPGSAAQQLGSLLPLLQQQPLTLDKIFIHTPETTPEAPAVSFAATWVEGVRRFLNSFTPDPYQIAQGETGDLEVWVNRPRLYVNLLQLMADESFTPATGVRVNFSVMPDESKLVLAKAAGIEPDVALGVSTNVPFELAIRNALYDLRTFEDFDAFIAHFSPGALLSFIIDESVYALPETQDFWVTFYRRDILDALGMSVPDTWNEVLELLPELQRYGMNYNTPLSSGPGLKGYLLTAPYLFNHGAPLYADGGFATGLQSEEAIAAIRFMAESFTVYGMPVSTSSFYESFRYGTLPLGVSNLETYVKLLTAAPELNGLWDIALYPATIGPDGKARRYATGSAQASIMFRDTEQPEAAWAFLKWWLSTETQAEFQERLMLNYGRAYLWSSANLEAFSRLNIPEAHRTVILEQWQWLQEPVRLPGFYMQERELSNVWNRIVFDGASVRVAIDGSVTSINREIARRMEEFGYLQDGKRVREFTIPTLETVKGWIEDAKRAPQVAR
jgi:ABC-type glycerol-3-phosphate transport system substrate-binding protein